MSVEEYREFIKKGGKTEKKTKADFSPSGVNPVDILRLYGFDPETSFYIKGHVYSSKNSKRILTRNVKEGQKSIWTCNGRSVIPFIGDSEGVEAYRKATWYIYKDLAGLFRKRVADHPNPLIIQFTFIRMDNQGFDFPNICQLVMDSMVYYKWIEDDEIKYILPVPPLPPKPSHYVSEKNAGVIITII